MNASYYTVASVPNGDNFDVTFTGYVQGQVVGTFTYTVNSGNLQSILAEIPINLNFLTSGF